MRTVGRRARLGALAAVLVVAVAVPVLRTQLRPVPDPPAPTDDTESAEPAPVVSRPPEPFVANIDFADREHGFALRTHCYDVRTPCRTDLLVTADGSGWQIRSLPPRKAEGPRTAIDRLWVLGSREVVVGESFPTPRPGRWHSADAGQTWQRVADAVEPGVPAVPEGGALELVCQEPAMPPANCTRTALMVTLPGSGQLAPLGPRPALDLRFPHLVPASADGVRWVSGLVPGSDRWAVAASGDSGRTWSVAELPGRLPVERVEISAGPGVVYAAAVEPLPGITNGLTAIFRSTDGGRGWQRTWWGAPDREPSSIAGSPVAADDGRLFVSTEAGVRYVSTDGGSTFSPDGADPPVGLVRWTRAGYLAAVKSLSTVYRLSADGVRWKEITVG